MTDNLQDAAPTPDSSQADTTPASATPSAPPADQATEVATQAAAHPPVKNWRDEIAGDDAKARAQLERFASPAEVWKSYRALQQKLSSGEVKAALPKDATPEQVTQWRAENGIPDSPEGYDTTLDGVVIGEQDRPLVGEFLKSMHGVNARPEAVKAALSAYYQLVERQQQAQAEADAQYRQRAEDALRAEWGNDYRTNENIGGNFLSLAPEGLREALSNARLADGSLFKDNPDARRWMAQMGREMNPLGTVVSGSGPMALESAQSEMKAIESKMGTKAYTPADRQRYAELVEATQKHASRS